MAQYEDRSWIAAVETNNPKKRTDSMINILYLRILNKLGIDFIYLAIISKPRQNCNNVLS